MLTPTTTFREWLNLRDADPETEIAAEFAWEAYAAEMAALELNHADAALRHSGLEPTWWEAALLDACANDLIDAGLVRA